LAMYLGRERTRRELETRRHVVLRVMQLRLAG
jgi:hypothetical protein